MSTAMLAFSEARELGYGDREIPALHDVLARLGATGQVAESRM